MNPLRYVPVPNPSDHQKKPKGLKTDLNELETHISTYKENILDPPSRKRSLDTLLNHLTSIQSKYDCCKLGSASFKPLPKQVMPNKKGPIINFLELYANAQAQYPVETGHAETQKLQDVKLLVIVSFKYQANR